MTELKVYSLDSIAELLGVTKRTLYNYIKAGQIKAFKVGKEWRVTQSELEKFLETGTESNYMEKL